MTPILVNLPYAFSLLCIIEFHACSQYRASGLPEDAALHFQVRHRKEAVTRPPLPRVSLHEMDIPSSEDSLAVTEVLKHRSISASISFMKLFCTLIGLLCSEAP